MSRMRRQYRWPGTCTDLTAGTATDLKSCKLWALATFVEGERQRQTDRQTDRDKDRQTDGQTDRGKDRQTDR